MDADWSIELGGDDPVLDFPWTDPAGKLAYFDLKRQPELIAKIDEGANFPGLAEFLRKVNSPRSKLESAKCDLWATTELSPEEEIFNASHKFASYVDLVFSENRHRGSLPLYEDFARRLTELLRRAPEINASAQLCIRRCFFNDAAKTTEGFYYTLYVSGYGNEEGEARKSWTIAAGLAGHAIVQLSAEIA